jgi:hypothetical protein
MDDGTCGKAVVVVAPEGFPDVTVTTASPQLSVLRGA